MRGAQGSEYGVLLRVCLQDKNLMASWQLALRLSDGGTIGSPFMSR